MRRVTASLLNINEAQLTINILDKLARLSVHDWAVQMILVDNGSDADQLQQLTTWFTAHKDRFAELLFVTAAPNLGATGGRNIALKLASSNHILILDNDLILPEEPFWLDRLWQCLEKHPQIGIVGPMLVFADYPDIVQGTGVGLTNTGRVGYLNRAAPIASITPDLVDVIASPSACWLVRRRSAASHRSAG